MNQGGLSIFTGTPSEEYGHNHCLGPGTWWFLQEGKAMTIDLKNPYNATWLGTGWGPQDS